MRFISREIQHAKCIAVLKKIFMLKLISETEYILARDKINSKYMVVFGEDKK